MPDVWLIMTAAPAAFRDEPDAALQLISGAYCSAVVRDEEEAKAYLREIHDELVRLREAWRERVAQDGPGMVEPGVSMLTENQNGYHARLYEHANDSDDGFYSWDFESGLPSLTNLHVFPTLGTQIEIAELGARSQFEMQVTMLDEDDRIVQFWWMQKARLR